MLYLPPHYAHDGVAIGDCQTYSIGFRSPSFQELGEAFLQFMADSIDLPGRYSDPDLKATSKPAEIPRDMLAAMTEELNKVRFTEEDITIFLGEYLSEPKHNVFFTPVEAAHGRPFGTPHEEGCRAVAQDADAVPWQECLHQWRIVWRRQGRQGGAGTAGQRTRLDGAPWPASDDVLEALYTWYQDGWIELA
jgi:50S ribosomal protein L16 3-hydroxylase